MGNQRNEKQCSEAPRQAINLASVDYATHYHTSNTEQSKEELAN